MNPFELWQFEFFRNALTAGFVSGIGCSAVGVYLIILRTPFISVVMSHAAMTGAVFALLAGWPPWWCGFACALLAAGAIGPLTDHSHMDPNIAMGILFSLLMGLTFLGIGLAPGPRQDMLGLIWGSILLLSASDVRLMLLATATAGLVLALFYKELKAILFSRMLADASGIQERLIYYLLLLICGAMITINLDTVGGLMLFSLIINPAAAAYQWTYRLPVMFVLATLFGAGSAVAGLAWSALADLPSGACVVITSSVLFSLSLLLSPKRKALSHAAIHTS